MNIHDSPARLGCSVLLDFYRTPQAGLTPDFNEGDEHEAVTPPLVGVTGQTCSLNSDYSFGSPEMAEQDRPSPRLDLPGGGNKWLAFLPMNPKILIHRLWLDIGCPIGFKRAQLEIRP